MVFLTKADVFYLDSVWKRGNINFLDNGSQILDQNNTHMQKQNLIKIYLLSLEVQEKSIHTKILKLAKRD